MVSAPLPPSRACDYGIVKVGSLAARLGCTRPGSQLQSWSGPHRARERASPSLRVTHSNPFLAWLSPRKSKPCRSGEAGCYWLAVLHFSVGTSGEPYSALPQMRGCPSTISTRPRRDDWVRMSMPRMGKASLELYWHREERARQASPSLPCHGRRAPLLMPPPSLASSPSKG